MILSICIPTFNRAKHLSNCLNSILLALQHVDYSVEICVSNNCSTDDTEKIIANFPFPINYKKNKTNIGIANNFLEVVAMAKGEYVWLIGDDDLLMEDSLVRLGRLLIEQPSVDFFYVNAYHLTTEFVFSQPQPFDVAKPLPEMEKFSNCNKEGALPFLDLIDYNRSFDFLGGIFLAVFRRKKWHETRMVLVQSRLNDPRQFSSLDNTFPHAIIFAHAFSKSRAYFCTRPHIICLTGAREWAPMYKMIKSVRLVELLEVYREVGLSWGNYFFARNAALRTFLPDIVWMKLNPKISGSAYVTFWRIFMKNIYFPNAYLSLLYFAGRKLRLGVARLRKIEN